MSEQLFYLERQAGISLQTQIQQMLVALILDGHLLPGSALPSCRKLAKILRVSRNTVVLVYERLVDEGYLLSAPRAGHYVNPDIVGGLPASSAAGDDADEDLWGRRFQCRPGDLPQLHKTRRWRDCRYPFVYGQLDPELFPAAEWRDCSRQATSSLVSREWLVDSVDQDDPLLIQQLRNRVLPRRGIRCRDDEILLTLGTQHSLYLLATLLMGPNTRVGMESPGYLDACNIFRLAGASIEALPVDQHGLQLGPGMDACDYLFVTPSHQFPTTVTLPLARRQALLERAEASDLVVIEDDYECEINFSAEPTPALKSLDREGRVLYVGSLSKTLAPGLRMGYLVAPAPLIREARALRRLMLRHPPANNQRTLALFLAGGYHDSLVRRLTATYRQRRELLLGALARELPEVTVTPCDGGSSVWCEGPVTLDCALLQQRALAEGLFLEAMSASFLGQHQPRHFFRLGYAAIRTERIVEGVGLLARLVKDQLRRVSNSAT